MRTCSGRCEAASIDVGPSKAYVTNLFQQRPGISGDVRQQYASYSPANSERMSVASALIRAISRGTVRTASSTPTPEPKGGTQPSDKTRTPDNSGGGSSHT
jgi:hypothetical protein